MNSTYAQDTPTYIPSGTVDAASPFKEFFLSDDPRSVDNYLRAMQQVSGMIARQIQGQERPYSGLHPADIQSLLGGLALFPETGADIGTVLERTRELVLEHNISVYHPHCMAHLHCPAFIISLAAEQIIGAFNQSMDSYDQAPAATVIEQELCTALCRLYGFGERGDAVFTGGGTMSNFMGLLLARDHYSETRLGWNIQQRGLPPEASRFRVLCTEGAHFTVVQSMSILGLGADSVVKLPQDAPEGEAAALEAAILRLQAEGLLPIAYVATAGTTDFGAVAPLVALADCTARHGLWLHVDAAYGGALLFSKKHRHKLDGIGQADSVTVDFHKLFYQPISCGAFLLRNADMFRYIRLHAAYLNPEENGEAGIPDLVYKSIQTTRRFDALKPLLMFQQVGTDMLGQMIDHTIELAAAVSEIVTADPVLELAYRSPINTVVFRYTGAGTLSASLQDTVNSYIKRELLLSGKAIIGQTELDGKVYLKFTLLNPMTQVESVQRLLEDIKVMAEEWTWKELAVLN